MCAAVLHLADTLATVLIRRIFLVIISSISCLHTYFAWFFLALANFSYLYMGGDEHRYSAVCIDTRGGVECGVTPVRVGFVARMGSCT